MTIRSVSPFVISALLLGHSDFTHATNRVSISSDGQQANAVSNYSSVSPDGRFVAFLSHADNLSENDTNSIKDIFLHDFSTRETRLISISSNGTQADSHAPNELPSIADDGNVVFTHTASTLVSGDNNSVSDIFLYDRKQSTLTRVNLAHDGAEANAASSNPTISPDGRFVAFSSEASNLVPDDDNGQADIFVRDLQANTTTRVSLTSGGNEGTGSNSGTMRPSISRDGRFISFQTIFALTGEDTNNFSDIYVHDRESGKTLLVTKSTEGTPANEGSFSPSISEDGRLISFTSRASNLVENDTNRAPDIFLHDRDTGKTRLISVSSSGAQARLGAEGAKLAGEGRYVIFNSSSDDLVAQDTNQFVDTFLHDNITHRTHRVHLGNDGKQATGGVVAYPSISKDGNTIVFDSFASNLISNDTNGVTDTFAINRSSLALTDAHILWRHAQSGEVRLYVLSSAQLLSSHFLKYVRSQQWQLISLDDFNGDGQPDLFWRNQQTGQNWLDMTNNGQIITSRQVTRVADVRWKVAGTGDFNADGYTDILWRHQGTGVNWIYLMRSGDVIQSKRLNTVKDLNWQVAALGDLNGDNKTDILWRHAIHGNNWIYQIDGVNLTDSKPLNRVPDTRWEIQQLADFDADGQTDILWRHKQNGKNWVYLLDNTRIRNSRLINRVDTNWQIVGTPDINADGAADIVWRHTRTGMNWIYLMQGSQIQRSLRLNQVSDTDWQVQAIK